MKKSFFLALSLYLTIFCLTANSYLLFAGNPVLLTLSFLLALFINIFAGFYSVPTRTTRLKVCYHGTLLLSVFVISVFFSIAIHGFMLLAADPAVFLWSVLFCVGTHFVLFWNGILCVYLTSIQLGIKHRVIGALCGLIPIANLIILHRIIRITLREVFFEIEKEALNEARKAQQFCATKYPILLVHGVFFRDSKHFNYWGRIPAELERNGAKVFYGNHQSASAIADSAAELTARIHEILLKTGAEKVNIIAHSKGGLDCRYAMAKLGAAPYIASLTTINTPHQGCVFADYLLHVIPDKIKKRVADTYNNTLKKLGDESPDFLAAVSDLTASYCTKLSKELSAPTNVYCQSVGSVLSKATGGKFPMNAAFPLVKHFDGDNDGLVAERSFPWGEKYTLIKPAGRRGISHGDMIDLNRENIVGFDVREFYVNLVADLKSRNL